MGLKTGLGRELLFPKKNKGCSHGNFDVEIDVWDDFKRSFCFLRVLKPVEAQKNNILYCYYRFGFFIFGPMYFV